jgi:hypothetical protein
VGVVWVWCGCGVGVVWVWCGCGVGVVWVWVWVWVWCGCGCGVGVGVGVVWRGVAWCGVVVVWCGSGARYGGMVVYPASFVQRSEAYPIACRHRIHTLLVACEFVIMVRCAQTLLSRTTKHKESLRLRHIQAIVGIYFTFTPPSFSLHNYITEAISYKYHPQRNEINLENGTGSNTRETR